MADEFEGVSRVVRNRTGLKALALVLAFICWYMIREETSYEQTIRGVAVDLKAPADFIVVSQSAEYADVLFRGSRSDLRGLTREDVQIEVDLAKSEAAKSNLVLKLSPKHVHAPAGVRALRVVPSSVNVRIGPRNGGGGTGG